MTGPNYACNLKSESDYIWLQSLSRGTKYACNHQNFVFARFVQKIIVRMRLWDNFWHCKHIWSLLKNIASISGFNRFFIASIFCHKNYCNHMWPSPIQKRVNSCRTHMKILIGIFWNLPEEFRKIHLFLRLKYFFAVLFWACPISEILFFRYLGKPS